MLYGLIVAIILGLVGIQGSGSSVIILLGIGLMAFYGITFKAIWGYRKPWARTVLIVLIGLVILGSLGGVILGNLSILNVILSAMLFTLPALAIVREAYVNN